MSAVKQRDPAGRWYSGTKWKIQTGGAISASKTYILAGMRRKWCETCMMGGKKVWEMNHNNHTGEFGITKWDSGVKGRNETCLANRTFKGVNLQTY